MFKMGANLDDEIWDTQKEKKSKKDTKSETNIDELRKFLI